jgi:poly(beta-D-mannuronate) C5 epimerase
MPTRLSLLACALLLASNAALANTAAPAKPAAEPGTVKELHQAKTYTISSAPTAPLDMAAPKLPDLTGYTEAAVEAKLKPLRNSHAKVSIRRMMQEDVLKEFIGGNNKMAEWVVRQHGIPQAIFIENGYLNLKDLTKTVPKQYFSETSPGVFLARLPIVVGNKAVLEIDKRTQELRLSQEAGAFIINDGKLFTSNTKVTGWREKDNGPATFRAPKEFRPFLLSWGGTETYIVNTSMASFGYNQSKSYGVSISQYTPNMSKQMGRSEPTAELRGQEQHLQRQHHLRHRPARPLPRADHRRQRRLRYPQEARHHRFPRGQRQLHHQQPYSRKPPVGHRAGP